jgi:hypothetical protein
MMPPEDPPIAARRAARRARPPAGRRPGAPAPLGPRGTLSLLLRFALAYVAIGLLLYASPPVLMRLIARGARDLLILSSQVPPIWDVAWVGDWQIQLATPLLGRGFGGAERWWPFTLLFPLGFAAAVPGVAWGERLHRALVICVGGLAVSCIVLACNGAHALGEALRSLGLLLYPEWRADLHFRIAFWTWSIAAIAYPLAASLYALAPAIPGLGSSQTPQSPRSRRKADRKRRATARRRLVGWVALAIALVGLDLYASRRLARLDLDGVVAALESFNPDLGAYFVVAGERELGAGRVELARRYFQIGLRYPQHGQRALRGLEQARSATSERRAEEPR